MSFIVGNQHIPITNIPFIINSPYDQLPNGETASKINMSNYPLTNVYSNAILTKIRFDQNCDLFIIKFEFGNLIEGLGLFFVLCSLINNLLYMFLANGQEKEVRIIIQNFIDVGISFNDIKKQLKSYEISKEDIKLNQQTNTISITMFGYSDDDSDDDSDDSDDGMISGFNNMSTQNP